MSTCSSTSLTTSLKRRRYSVNLMALTSFRAEAFATEESCALQRFSILELMCLDLQSGLGWQIKVLVQQPWYMCGPHSQAMLFPFTYIWGLHHTYTKGEKWNLMLKGMPKSEGSHQAETMQDPALLPTCRIISQVICSGPRTPKLNGHTMYVK